MAKKKLGIIMNSYDREPLLSIYKDIIEAAKASGYVTYSNMIYMSRQATANFNAGEVSIFESMDYSKYDALIVVLNSIDSLQTRETILEKINKLDIPKVSIDCEVPNAINIQTDNYVGSKMMVEHMIKVHGCRKINYISGPLENGEALQRYNAYIDGMRENGLDPTGRVFEGTFFFGDGEGAYNYFAENEKASDYEAVICANDFSAFSFISELEKRGVSVPEQVKVVGFDNTLEANSSMFSLTSVYKNGEKLGSQAVNLLDRIFAGEELKKEYTYPCKVVCRRSCGCVPDAYMQREMDASYYEDYSAERLLKIITKTTVEKAVACDSFEDFVEILQHLIEKIKPAFFEFSLFTEYGDVIPLEKYEVITDEYADGKNRERVVIIRYGNRENCSQFISSPLHYSESSLGYLDWGDSKFPLTQDLYWDLLTSMDLTLYAIHSKLELNDLYRKDYLTGLYNRYGLKYFWDNFVLASVNSKSDISIIFADINNLKIINDELGHEAGDVAIKATATALRLKMSKTVKAFRYGGDEFILLCYGKSEEEIKNYIEDFEREVDSFGFIEGSDIKLSSSFGYFIKKYGDETSLEDCLSRADEAMYINKLAFHKLQGK